MNRLIITIIMIIIVIFPSAANAQTPSSWQQNASGLRTQNNAEKKTAGLSILVADKSWPFLSLQGGVQDAGWGFLEGPVGIDLGLVKIPNTASSSFSSETADWSGNRMTFNTGSASQLEIWSSRLTSGILIQTSSGVLRLFAGNLRTNIANGTSITGKPPAPSYPKYIAYSTGGTIQIKQLSSTTFNLPQLDNNWLLVWYGNSSHFSETKKPIVYPYPIPGKSGCCNNATVSNPHFHAYQADAPMLLRFQNAPASVVHSSEGGIDVSFAAQSGYTTVMPILGREHPAAATTEGWGTSGTIPSTITQKISFWVQRSCDFPSNVAESYNYNAGTDTVTVTDNITFIPTGCAGTKYAPISPMLSVAKNAMNIQFNGTLVDGNLATEFGPTFGIDGATSYSWSMTGLKKYVDYTRPPGTSGQAPPEIMQTLISEVDKITAAGHYAPWLVSAKMSFHPGPNEINFLNPADIIYILTEVIPILPEPQKTNLLNYLKNERANYPPETVFNLSLGQGTFRGPFNTPDQIIGGMSVFSSINAAALSGNYVFLLRRVPLYNFYALSRYYDLTADPIPSSVLSAGSTALDNDMAEQDFANMYWFLGFDDKKTAVENTNRHLAGLLGLARLAKKTGDSNSENLATSLLAKAVVLRIAMAQYPGYLYTNNLVELPSNADWQPQIFTGINWFGVLYNYNWIGASDDARVATTLNQYTLILHDNAGFRGGFSNVSTEGIAYLPAFKGMVPEEASLLSDFARAEAQIPINKLAAILPHWYAAFIDTPYGNEKGFMNPSDSYNTFLGKVWIQGESAQNLYKYTDIPWLSTGGDLFYLHKLAETVRAYQGGTGGAAPTATPTPTGGQGAPQPTATPTPTPSGLSISGVTDNKSSYANSQVPSFEKFEISFNINNTVATNLQLPFEASPPAGLVVGQGITVNAEFSQDNFQTKSIQPAFYYQDFDYQIKGSNEWFYPKNQFSWKVRFAPTNTGNWQYRITAQDASGTTTSAVQTFTVAANPNNHGFIKVSQKDRRYFEYDDGTYFPGLSINATWQALQWNNPVTSFALKQ